MEEIQLEQAFLKSTYETLYKSYMTRKKLMHRELDALTKSVSTMGPSMASPDVAAVADRLLSLKNAVELSRREGQAAVQRAVTRVRHLSERPSTQSGQRSRCPAAAAWDKVRLDRIIVDYMLREGFYDVAKQYADAEHIEELVELQIFDASRVVIDALKKKDCSVALQWCNANRRRLSRIDSSLEFKLRTQQFVELARAGNSSDAIAYVRNNLLPAALDSSVRDQFERMMTLLAFRPDTSCQPYKHMYAEERWADLIQLFVDDNFRLHGLPKESVLEIVMKAGLSSLKTRRCAKPDTINTDCPTCCEPFSSLSANLPRAQHLHSILVCRISKAIMDENNPPMVLPNGNVYSNNALVKMAADNDGTVVDPRTGESFKLAELRKCFIM